LVSSHIMCRVFFLFLFFVCEFGVVCGVCVKKGEDTLARGYLFVFDSEQCMSGCVCGVGSFTHTPPSSSSCDYHHHHELLPPIASFSKDKCHQTIYGHCIDLKYTRKNT
jgi:hypothetical protein